nr:aminoglycoside phosphotransferase family protein [Paenibacillus pasadenensis]
MGGRFNQHWLVNFRGEQLVLRRWWLNSAPDIDYELRLLTSIAKLGWPVAPAVNEPIELSSYFWCLFPYLSGDPPPVENRMMEQRTRGELLAKFHTSLAQLTGFEQRENWRRCEEILGDLTLDRILSENDQKRPEEISILRWHLDRARERIIELKPQIRSGIIIHGDFTPWNLRFKDGCLSGILDFELAHWNHRIADFALSWRGVHDEVIHAYNDFSPLEPEEWELITPMWWAWLIESACRDMAKGILIDYDGWIIKHLLRRSPLMGQDSVEFR